MKLKKLKVLNKCLVFCVALLMYSVAWAHEVNSSFTAFTTSSLSLKAFLHWALSHQGLVTLVSILLLGITLKTLGAKRQEQLTSKTASNK